MSDVVVVAMVQEPERSATRIVFTVDGVEKGILITDREAADDLLAVINPKVAEVIDLRKKVAAPEVV